MIFKNFFYSLSCRSIVPEVIQCCANIKMWITVKAASVTIYITRGQIRFRFYINSFQLSTCMSKALDLKLPHWYKMLFSKNLFCVRWKRSTAHENWTQAGCDVTNSHREAKIWCLPLLVLKNLRENTDRTVKWAFLTIDRSAKTNWLDNNW